MSLPTTSDNATDSRTAAERTTAEVEIETDCSTTRDGDREPQNNLVAKKRPRGRPRKDGKPAGSVKKERMMSDQELKVFRRKIGKLGMEARIKKHGKITSPGRPRSIPGEKMPVRSFPVREIDHAMVSKWAQLNNCTLCAMFAKMCEFYHANHG